MDSRLRIKQLGRCGLHAESEFIRGDARCDLLVASFLPAEVVKTTDQFIRACSSYEPCPVGSTVWDGVTRRGEWHSLIHRRQKAIGEEARTAAASAARRQNDEPRKVLRFATKTVQCHDPMEGLPTSGLPHVEEVGRDDG